MIIAIQQPEHLPWIGFFNKMLLADEFIYLDNVQFKKRYFENRNKIRTLESWDWLTVPVNTKGLYTQKINEVEIDNNQDWQRKYLNKLKANYAKAAFFDEIFSSLTGIVDKEYKRLLEFNLKLIDFVRGYLGIATAVSYASDIAAGKGSDLILDLCLKRKTQVYLSGPDGRNYLNLDEFRRNNIEVRYHDYIHPEYRQLYGNFIHSRPQNRSLQAADGAWPLSISLRETAGFSPRSFISHMSVVDILFNYGRSAIEIIKGKFNT